MQNILVADFSDADQQGVLQGVLNVILPIQQREFDIPQEAFIAALKVDS